MEGKIARKHFYPAKNLASIFHTLSSSAFKKLEKVDWNERYPIKFFLLLAAMHAQQMCIQPDFFLKCTLQTMD